MSDIQDPHISRDQYRFLTKYLCKKDEIISVIPGRAYRTGFQDLNPFSPWDADGEKKGKKKRPYSQFYRTDDLICEIQVRIDAYAICDPRYASCRLGSGSSSDRIRMDSYSRERYETKRFRSKDHD